MQPLELHNRHWNPRWKATLQRHWIVYLMATPVLLHYLIFRYFPMFGIVVAFQDFRVTRGFLGSQWVGFRNFLRFLESAYAWTTIRNTLSISILSLLFAFPMPILLAIMLNEVPSRRFKKTVQTVTYMPHFISLVVICSLIINFFSNQGLINSIIRQLGGKAVNFMSEPRWFYPIYIGSGIWQHTGWDSIIYLAALSAIDTELYEAATVDGAGRLQRMWHITLPGISATITILLILRMGSLLSVGFEKIILLYTPATYETADTISTYVYRRGLNDGKYSFASAVGLMNNIVNFLLLLAADKFSKRIGQSGLF